MPSPSRHVVTASLAILLALLLAGPAVAQCQKTTLVDIEDEVMCEQCGVPLALATDAPQAKAERAFIRDLIAQCQTKEQIKDALRAEFGPGVLALPSDEGFGLAAYLVPVIVLLIGGGGVGIAVVRWRRAREIGQPDREPPAAAGTSAETERLHDELRRFDR